MAAVRHLGFVVCVFGHTHKGHLVVFIAVQNLVGIDAVVLIICMYFDFTSWLENAYSRPKIVFLGILTPKWEQCQRNPQKAHSCASPRRLSHHARKSVDASDL